MQGQGPAISSSELRATQQRLERWRVGKPKQARIPETLWAEAVQLAQVEGVHRTSKQLRVNYERLKRRVVAAVEDHRDHTKAARSFVELSMDELSGIGGTRIEDRKHGNPLQVNSSRKREVRHTTGVF